MDVPHTRFAIKMFVVPRDTERLKFIANRAEERYRITRYQHMLTSAQVCVMTARSTNHMVAH